MADVSRVTGPLGPFAAGFVDDLSRQGFKPETVGKHVALVAGLSSWLAAEGIAAVGVVVRGRRALRRGAARGGTQHPADDQGARSAAGVSARAGRRAAGKYASVRRTGRGATFALPAVSRARAWLGPAAAGGYVEKVRPFVARFEGSDGLELWRVDVAEVRAFVVERCPRLGLRAAQLTVVALRSLLRFLHLDGALKRSLAGAVPSVFGPRLSGLPKRLEPGQVDALLASCDRSTVIGVRDLAILTLLARLGLRAAEVAALSLEDIDWRAGELVVRGKGARCERLPLPADVGEAIVGYLRDGRPASALDRSVFVRVRAPHHRLSPGGVTFVVEAAGLRAGLGTIHAHRLRHTAASEVLRAGATLPEVGQVLRHRHARSTAIYAKVDREALREIARAWPGAPR